MLAAASGLTSPFSSARCQQAHQLFDVQQCHTGSEHDSCDYSHLGGRITDSRFHRLLVWVNKMYELIQFSHILQDDKLRARCFRILYILGVPDARRRLHERTFSCSGFWVRLNSSLLGMMGVDSAWQQDQLGGDGATGRHPLHHASSDAFVPFFFEILRVPLRLHLLVS